MSVLAVGQTSSTRTSHGALYFWGRHISQDICHPRKFRLFPHPRDILVHGDEIDSGGSVTLGVYIFVIVTLIIFPCSFSARYLFNIPSADYTMQNHDDVCPINDMIMSISIIQFLLICYVMIFSPYPISPIYDNSTRPRLNPKS